MSKVIHKYNLQPGWQIQSISLPRNAQILTVQVQDGSPCIWALIDSNEMSVAKTFTCYGTGIPLPEDSGFYLGTVQVGGLVWHYFEAN